MVVNTTETMTILSLISADRLVRSCSSQDVFSEDEKMAPRFGNEIISAQIHLSKITLLDSDPGDLSRISVKTFENAHNF